MGKAQVTRNAMAKRAARIRAKIRKGSEVTAEEKSELARWEAGKRTSGRPKKEKSAPAAKEPAKESSPSPTPMEAKADKLSENSAVPVEEPEAIRRPPPNSPPKFALPGPKDKASKEPTLADEAAVAVQLAVNRMIAKTRELDSDCVFIDEKAWAQGFQPSVRALLEEKLGHVEVKKEAKVAIGGAAIVGQGLYAAYRAKKRDETSEAEAESEYVPRGPEPAPKHTTEPPPAPADDRPEDKPEKIAVPQSKSGNMTPNSREVF